MIITKRINVAEPQHSQLLYFTIVPQYYIINGTKVWLLSWIKKYLTTILYFSHLFYSLKRTVVDCREDSLNDFNNDWFLISKIQNLPK